MRSRSPGAATRGTLEANRRPDSLADVWIVDIEARAITQYEWRDGRYGEPVVLHPGETLSCPLFPGVTRAVAAIFAGIE